MAQRFERGPFSAQRAWDLFSGLEQWQMPPEASAAGHLLKGCILTAGITKPINIIPVV